MKRLSLGLLGASLVLAALITSVHVRVDPARDLDPGRGVALRVLDRHGTPLRTLPATSQPLRGAWVGLERVRSLAVLTLLSGEDQRFFEHTGVDPWSLLRALWLDLRAGAPRYGASTLSMQLARVAYPEHATRSWLGKLRQALLARAIERTFDKRSILEQYLNRVYFGHGAYGIEAAAQTYFQRPAHALSDAQATLLMVLPRGPATYDLLRHRERALLRRKHLLGLLERQGRLAHEARRRIEAEALDIRIKVPAFRAGHFVDHALSELPGAERARGGELYTTLDLPLQIALEHRTKEHLAGLSAHDAQQAGVVVLSTQTGEVLAMVGSRGYSEVADGQLNIVTRRRYPGSALKPFVYAAAIAQGRFTGSLAFDVYDVPSRYAIKGMVPAEHGPARYREALAGSYNLAAVHVLEEVGIEPVMNLLKKAGVGALELAPEAYGLRLSLGSTRVRLLDLASSYGVFVREGTRVPPRALRRLERADGTRYQPAASAPARVLSREVSWLVMDMLSDPEARRPRFGDDLPFDLPYRVAAKTGTARGFSDTVAIAATSELTVAAWTGRFDGRPMQGLSGMRGAAELARAALLLASHGRDLTLPQRPQGVTPVEVCPLSGKLPGPHCPHRKREFALRTSVPSERCNFHMSDGVRYPAQLSAWAQRTHF